MSVEPDPIVELEKKIAELKSRWPAHSVPSAMLMQLDELEEQLAQLRQARSNEPETSSAN